MRVHLDNPLVAEFLNKQAGDAAYKVVKTLKSGMTDDKISKKLKMDVNATRAVLNKLHYLGIIDYDKEKEKNSNWYTFTWFLRKERITELLAEKYKEELQELEKKLSFEQSYTFFKCNNNGSGCKKLPFELACEYNFKCPDCGNSMEAFENAEEKKSLQKKIEQIEKLLG